MVTVEAGTNRLVIDMGMAKPYLECKHERRLRCYAKTKNDRFEFRASKEAEMKICLDCAAVFMPGNQIAAGWVPQVFFVQPPADFPYSGLFNTVQTAMNILRTVAKSQSGLQQIAEETYHKLVLDLEQIMTPQDLSLGSLAEVMLSHGEINPATFTEGNDAQDAPTSKENESGNEG